MTTIFFKDPRLKTWKLIAIKFDKSVARRYATVLRESGYEAFASNRAIHNHRSAVLRRFGSAEI